MTKRLVLHAAAMLVVIFVVGRDVSAWNPTGHRTIASMMFRRLSHERAMELAELLRAHPRFEEDFISAMPAAIESADRELQAEWLFQQASCWPDIVRGGPPERKAFDRPFWHYLPRGYYLTDAPVEFRSQVDTSFNSDLTPVGGAENENLNGPQALKVNLAVVYNSAAAAADRAVALCWVLHIAQDLHQPCHTASLCTPKMFPEGDRGANWIPTTQLRNLHAVWDSPLGSDDRFEVCRNLAILMLGNAQEQLSEIEVCEIDSEVEKWMAEGLELADSAVYTAEVRHMVVTADSVQTVDLTPEYLRAVRAVADRRLLLAGVRLSALLDARECSLVTPP
ncbi:MAG: S1/P1 nuclease [Planctomycetaceae bacterium]|nr:S1/P1 nuclease [Planctomycetaceae bacterium]